MEHSVSPRRTRQRTREERQGANEATRTFKAAENGISGPNTNPKIQNMSEGGTPLTPDVSVSTSNSPHLVTPLPSTLKPKQTGLPISELRIMHLKQQWLHTQKIEIPLSNPHPCLLEAVNATLVFAQEEAGTAICISPEGLLLTCSHCIAETPAELRKTRIKWLVFASGQAVKAECIAWDPKRDLALLKIVAAQMGVPTSTASGTSTLTFPYISLLPEPPSTSTPLLCIGHPGSEDLEASTPGQKTNYNVLHVSKGKFHGYALEQDPQDNSEIGALKHDCWTYWGHSGAPLVERKTGCLVGLHSSWDEETGMRRGIGWEALKGFLWENGSIASSV